jgi:hypothetical protein
MPVLFKTGRLVATPGALDLLARNETPPVKLLNRHVIGDWGDMSKEDVDANDDALRHGGRLFSCYSITPSDRVWIITEADRSATTILLPEDY